jgi:DNA-directed RNA polymerase subunit beta'
MVSSQKKEDIMEFINYTVDKKKLGALLSSVYEKYGTARTAELANSLKDLGFQFATKAGVTISIDDLDVPEAKRGLISAAEHVIEEAQRRYERGEITEVERYNKVIDTWSATTDQLTKEVIDNFDRLNPVYMMAFSGARGNISQVRQLVGMRGLMADSQGQIIDLPIKANFREGLNVTEYIISSYGARKGLVDTALKTADSGYLTRRLVDVAQDVIVRDLDCRTKRGIQMQPISEGDKIMVRLSERIYGRTVAEDVVNLETGEVILRAGELISRITSENLEKEKIKSVKVRSPLTCESQYGVCQKCYGWSLTNNHLVDVGEAIGIIAAQSIGEPGTQLTMRTFHTGGAVAGGSSRAQLKAPAAGELTFKIPTKSVRTAYGDLVEQTTKEGTLKVVTGGTKDQTMNVPTGSLILLKAGTQVTVGTVLAEYDPPGAKKNLTERATKDITADISGRIMFAGFQADEKRDRQGNISRTANRAGIIWVLEGDVYNLPSGAHVVVKDGQDVNAHDVLAEIQINTEHGGEVRFGPEIETETVKVGKKGTITRLVKGKEINVIIASVGAANAKLEPAKQGSSWRVTKSKEGFTIKVVEGEIVENGKIIAELIDDGTNVVTSGGEIIYDGVEIDDRRVVTKAGRILFVPEEVHFISKDISLKMSESGDSVTAGQEVVKDVFAHMDGVIEIVSDNDIIHEVIVRPGELLSITDPVDLKVPEGMIVEPGTEVVEGHKFKDRKMVNILEKEDGSLQVLIRPIEEYWIEPKETKFKHRATDDKISLRSVTQLLFRDREKVRNLQGAQLTRTSLVLQMQGQLQGLKGIVEFSPDDMNIVVQENILLRRETDLNVTLLAVQHGDMVPAKSAVATTQVLTKGPARVQLSKTDERRILLITDEQQTWHKCKGAVSAKEGDLLRSGDSISKSSAATTSGQVVKVEGTDVVVRRGRPYLISGNTQLQCEDGALVQRGDLLATLVYERQKTGDIVQGLPRVEELLEARKPKECAILAEKTGRARLMRDEDQHRLFLVYGEGAEEEIIIPSGLNIIVEDGEQITPGKPLTDGPPNPHDVVRLRGIESAQKYLVDEVQSVYRSQGVEIADKHIEVIVRQMTRKVRVDEPGETIMLPGELLERYYIDQENEKARQLGIKDATYTAVLLGITKASLNTESFISAASFQETTRILTEAAVEGKKDWLRGLKENVIIGRLIPAGTGFQGHAMPQEEEEEEEDIYPPIGEGSFNVPV